MTRIKTEKQFEIRLDKFWENQEGIYNFMTDINFD